jgi:hypothetical protein
MIKLLYTYQNNRQLNRNVIFLNVTRDVEKLFMCRLFINLYYKFMAFILLIEFRGQ